MTVAVSWEVGLQRMPPIDFLCKAKLLWVGEDGLTRGKDAAASRRLFSILSRLSSIWVGAVAQPFRGGLRLLHGEIKMLMLDKDCARSFRPVTSRLDPNPFTSSGIRRYSCQIFRTATVEVHFNIEMACS